MDELFLAKVRLAVVAELLAAEWVTFTELQHSVEATNGNLGMHLQKLAEAGYVQEEKRFVGKRPQTRYRLTRSGRAAFLNHVAELQALVAGTTHSRD